MKRAPDSERSHLRVRGPGIVRALVALASGLAVLALAPTALATPPATWETDIGTQIASISSVDDETTFQNGPGAIRFADIGDGTFTFPYLATIGGVRQVHTFEGDDVLSVSSNGFVHLIPHAYNRDGDAGNGCCTGRPEQLVNNKVPLISPFWVDLYAIFGDAAHGNVGYGVYLNSFDDNGDHHRDRVVITWNTQFYVGRGSDTLTTNHVQIQLQLFADGTIVFGYDGIAWPSGRPPNENVLVGLSSGDLGSAVASDPTPYQVDFVGGLPLSTGIEPTAFEVFSTGASGGPAALFASPLRRLMQHGARLAAVTPATNIGGLDGKNIVFIPNATGGYNVTDTVRPIVGPALSMNVSSPDTFSPGTPPGTLTVTASFGNAGTEADNALTTMIRPEAPLALATGEAASAALGTLASRGRASQTWHLTAPTDCYDHLYRFFVDADYTNSPTGHPARTAARTVIARGTCKLLSGTIRYQSGGGSTPLPGAQVHACLLDAAGAPTTSCFFATTDGTGAYSMTLRDGDWSVQADPGAAPPVDNLLRSDSQRLTIAGADQTWSATLQRVVTLPTGAGIGGEGYRGTLVADMPTVYWNSPWLVTQQGCVGGTADFTVRLASAAPTAPPFFSQTGLASTGTTADPAVVVYSVSVPPVYPNHGDAHVGVVVHCPGVADRTVGFDIYIDPSGNVKTVAGAPIAGATVTLYRSDFELGPYDVVADGSRVMSPANRHNPDTTDALGHFGWDVTGGWYKVRAEKAGCRDPANASKAYVETAPMLIPPEVTGLDLRLDCSAVAPPPPPPPASTSSGGGGSPTPGLGGLPDLGVALGVAPTTASPGDTVTFLAKVTDKGGLASHPQLTVTLPDAASVISVSTNRGSCTAGAAVSCSLDFLRADLEADVTILVRIGGAGTETARATVTEDESDTNTADNAATATLTVASRAPAAVAPTVTIAGGAFKPPLRAVRKGGVASYSVSLTLDQGASLRVAIVDPKTRRAVQLLKGSAAGGIALDRPAFSITTAALGTDRVAVSLRTKAAALKLGKAYQLTVTATGSGGSRTVVFGLRG